MDQKFTSNGVHNQTMDHKFTSNGVYGQIMDQKLTSNGVLVKLLINNLYQMMNMVEWNTDGTRIGTRNADGTRIEHGLEKGPAFIDQKGSHENQPNVHPRPPSAKT